MQLNAPGLGLNMDHYADISTCAFLYFHLLFAQQAHTESREILRVVDPCGSLWIRAKISNFDDPETESEVEGKSTTLLPQKD